MHITSIIAALIAAVILGILYKRMIQREIPKPIGRAQALVPVLFGGASMLVSGKVGIAFMAAVQNAGMKPGDYSVFFQTFFPALTMAALPEELVKFAAIIMLLIIFRKSTKNVYEIILIGAAVGLGFSIFEDYSYGSEVSTVIMRIPLLAGHMVYNMIMAEFIGRARHSSITGRGPKAFNYMLALLVPTILHALYDAGTATNKLLYGNVGPNGDPQLRMIGGILAAVVMLGTLILQAWILIRFRKKTEEFCGMKTV